MSLQSDLALMRTIYGSNWNYLFYYSSDWIKTNCLGDWRRTGKDYPVVLGCVLAHPRFDDKFKMDWERVDENCVYFRKKFSKEIQFTDIPAHGVLDYTCITSADIDEEITLYVYKDCGGVDPILIYTGWFTRRNCGIDDDECTIDVKITTIDDGYDCFLREYETEYNVMNVPGETLKHATWTPPYHRGRQFTDVIQYLLDMMDCGLTYKSNFFDNTDGTTKNYVTNVDPNPLNNLMLVDKADAIKVNEGGLIQYTTIHNISLKEIIRILRNHYDIRWYIDGTDFWIEHISNFTNAVGALDMHDLTTLRNKYDKQTYAWHTNKYDYKPVPNREEWSGGEWYTKMFSPFFSDYQYSAGKSETGEKMEFSSPDVSNDMQGIRVRTADFSKTGWVILPVYWYGGVGFQGPGWYYWDNNYLMYWDNLTGDYWYHRRPFIWGVCGYVYYTSANWYTRNYTTKEFSQRQVSIDLHGCCDPFDDTFDITDLVKTELGNGLIEKMSYTFMNDMLEIQLLYEAEDVDEPDYPTGTASATPTPTPTTTTRPTAGP